MNDIFIQDAIDLAEELFPYPDLLKVEYFQKYKKGYYEISFFHKFQPPP